MLFDDPLAPVSSRFPLGPPPEYWAECNDEPSEVGVRPYSLRGAVPLSTKGAPDVTYSYDPVRQIGLARGADGVDVPMARHTQPGATPGQTTGSSDGDPKNPPPEEVGNPDWQQD